MKVDRKKTISEIMESIHSLKHKFLDCYTLHTPLTPAQWAILDLVRDNGKIGVKDMATMLGVSGSAVTQLTDVLVKKKYLIREENKEDRRIIMVKLSPGSRIRLKKIEHKFLEAAENMFTPLSDNELKNYALLNKKITKGYFKNIKKSLI